MRKVIFKNQHERNMNVLCNRNGIRSKRSKDKPVTAVGR